MAKGKGKKAGASAGPHKKHGPKTKRFHGYDKIARFAMGRSGMLSKYSDREAFEQAVFARGVKGDMNLFWHEFCEKWSDSRAKQDEYFAQLKKK